MHVVFKSGVLMKIRIVSISLFLTLLLLIRPLFAGFIEKTEYRINPNDILDIAVYEEPDLCRTVKVDLSGQINYPLLGNIPVAGSTAREVAGKITELLAKDYLVNPQIVEVVVKESAKISILGRVVKPGTYELKTCATVLEAIVQAGGFIDQADSSDIRLIRMKGDLKKTINIDLKNITSKYDKQANVALEPGDLVMIGGISQTETQIVLFGEVKKPGVYPYKKGMTVIEAVASAGGLTEMAAADGTRIIREKNNKREVIKVPLGSILRGGNKDKNIDLEPNDAIVVPQSFF
jgi:polysaccharide export outer membrane protein